MNVLKFVLIAATACLVGAPCFAADTGVGTSGTTKEIKVTTGGKEAPAKELRVKIDKVQKDDNDDADDDSDDSDDSDDDFDGNDDEENPVASYPFGQPVIKEASKGVWSATLPGRGFNIVTQWTQEPLFKVERNPENKFEGAASLIAIKEGIPGQMGPGTATLIAYVYDPKALQIDTSSPAAVYKMFIDEPIAAAKQMSPGLSIKVDEPKGKQEKGFGIVEDARRKLTLTLKTPKNLAAEKGSPESLETVDQVLQTQYYRFLIGKDFVVLGLVMGDENVSEKEAQTFLDSITLKPKT